jgi:CheY-like chemotaxis protein
MRPLGANIPINLKQTATNTPLSFGNINTNNFSAPLAVALSATSEARSVVGLASRIVDDALTLVDDITDLCRFDQGQALVVDKEAVKVREVCIEALTRVPIPLGSRGVEVLLDIQAGTPGRAMADRGVLQRILALLMNFAVDAAANAVSKATQSQVTGKVILSLSDAAFCQAQASGSASSCKISVFYSNPPDGENVSTPSLDVASMYKDHSASFSHCEEDDNNMFASGVGRGGSMTRRTRLRENIERGMTTYQREKLGLGLSLVHHLVSAHGSDLRYEIVADETMSKFWFLLPLSLDFPERLNAERMLKDDMLQTASRPIKKPKVAESMESMAVSTSPILPLTAAPQFPPELSATQAYTPAIRAQAAAMPEAEEAESTTFTVKQPRQYPGVAPGARPLVLVVEDTDVSASLLCMHLRKLNCTSHRAENGEVALEMLRSAPDPRMYSLVLMDLRMPVMDGFEAAEIIRGSIASNIPIVALTGETNEEHKRKCEEIGFDAFETKPLKRPQLKELLQNLVPGYEPPSSPS